MKKKALMILAIAAVLPTVTLQAKNKISVGATDESDQTSPQETEYTPYEKIELDPVAQAPVTAQRQQPALPPRTERNTQQKKRSAKEEVIAEYKSQAITESQARQKLLVILLDELPEQELLKRTEARRKFLKNELTSLEQTANDPETYYQQLVDRMLK